MSRIEVADLGCPTTQTPPLFPDTSESLLVIEERVPTVSGEHPVLVDRDSLQVPVIDLRASGLVAIEDRASTPVEAVIGALMKDSSARTSLGVAPLESATIARAPFVIDTPVPTRPPLARIAPTLEDSLVAKPGSSAHMPRASTDESGRHRTAMPALDPSSAMPRGGRWHALVTVAKSVLGARWGRRHKTSRAKPIGR